MSSNTNTFEQALKTTIAEENKTLTENGAVGYSHTKSALLDFNFAVSSLRNKSEVEIQKMFSSAYYESPLLACKFLFMLRDCRQGMGERRTFRICMSWLANINSSIVVKLLPLFAEYGRFDDLFCLIDTDVSKYQIHCDTVNDTTAVIVELISKQLFDDIKNCEDGKPISLLAKWLPSINASSLKTITLAKFFCKVLNLSEKKYRKTLSALRKHIDVLEKKISANKWSEVDYEKVPSIANLKYKNAFIAHDKVRRTEYLNKLSTGEAKINASTVFPYDIVHKYRAYKNVYCYDYDGMSDVDQALETMWQALPDFTANCNSNNAIIVADSSGSMQTTISKSTGCEALDVAASLAIYFSEKLTGPFKDKTITFSSNPKYIDFLNCSTLSEKLNVFYQNAEVASTNIEKVFNIILKTAMENNLKQSEIPSNIVIISDMEFNQASEDNSDALFKVITKKWKDAGYELPKLVFWNVCSRTMTVPLQKNENGVALVSGFSPFVAKMVFSAKLDPYEVLVDALNGQRYLPVENAIKDII